MRTAPKRMGVRRGGAKVGRRLAAPRPPAPRTPLIAKPPAHSRTVARQQAIQRARRLGPGYKVAHHRNPRTGQRHYHVVRVRPGSRRLVVVRDYYPYPEPGPPPHELPHATPQSNRLLPYLPPINRHGPHYQRWLTWALARVRPLLAPPLVRRIALRLRSLSPGWERAERLLMRSIRFAPPTEAL